EQESMLSEHYDRLKNTYERLSSGITFDFSDDIRMSQLGSLIASWCDGKQLNFGFDAKDIIRSCGSDLHSWSDRFYITTKGELGDYVQEVRQSRARDAKSMVDLFEGWRKHPLHFEDAFNIETHGYLQLVASIAA